MYNSTERQVPSHQSPVSTKRQACPYIRFIGMVSYLSQYLPRLQELLQPMHKLTRSFKYSRGQKNTKQSNKLDWTLQCKENIEKIKDLLIKPPVLTMPNLYGDLHLYSDSNNTCDGGALFQIIDGKERLITYHSKVMQPSFERYTISEKELMALLVAITHFKYTLRGTHLYAFVDHSSLVQIMKSKSEIPTL